MMRVLVCGGRDYNDWETVRKTLYDLCDEYNLWSEPDQYGNALPTGLTIIHGGARGADSLADQWAVVNWVPFEEYKADWDTHGKKAGILRNIDMLATNPDLVIAFPGGRGTDHMVSIAERKGTPVRRISGDGSTFPKTTAAEGNNFID